MELALRRAPADAVVARIAVGLRDAGVRFDEIRVAARTLHPAIDSIGITWSEPAGIATGVFRHSESGSEAWLRSPLFHMIETGTTRMRRRIADPGERVDYPVFEDLAASGYTDYLSHLVAFLRSKRAP